jgi:hypothetical protein
MVPCGRRGSTHAQDVAREGVAVIGLRGEAHGLDVLGLAVSEQSVRAGLPQARCEVVAVRVRRAVPFKRNLATNGQWRATDQ